MNVRVNLNYPIYDGAEIVFKAPCDASEVTGLIVYYPGDAGVVSSEFAFADAHASDLGNIDALFKAGAVVKVIIDTDTNMAFVQNAVTNAYLEERFAGIGGGGGGSAEGVVRYDQPQNLSSEQAAQARKNISAVRRTQVGALIENHEKQNVYAELEVTEKDGLGRLNIIYQSDLATILGNLANGVDSRDAVTVGQLNAAIGDISSALDRIIAIQNELIGESGGMKTITFTVEGDNNIYTANEGMDWFDWVESEYNTTGFYIDGHIVRHGSEDALGLNGETVEWRDSVIADAVYQRL